jgi:branched-chain amino acid transport system permease protein
MSAQATEVMGPAAEAPQLWKPSARGWAARRGVALGILVGIVLITVVVPETWADRIAYAAIFAIIGVSVNVVLGYTGQISLGHHAFVGMSAFVSGSVVSNGDQSFFAGLLIAILVGAFSAGLLGLIALRIKGLYLALITLTYGFIATNSIFEIPALTRGGAGMPAPRPAGFESEQAYALLCLAFLAVTLFVDWRVVKSKVGRAVLALKESEAVASSYAVNVTLYKVLAFMLSGAFAGLAGSLFAHRNGIVVAADFSFQQALLWVLMVVVGGLGNRTGVVIGSVFFALFEFLGSVPGIGPPLERFLANTFHHEVDEFLLVLGPLLALITIIKFPGGIAEQISPITRWLHGERFTLHPEGKKPKRARGSLLHRLRPGRAGAAERSRSDEPTTEPEAAGDVSPGAPSDDTEPEAAGDVSPGAPSGDAEQERAK